MSTLGLSWRLIRRSTFAWVAASFVMIFAGSAAYRAGFPDQRSRDLFAATSGHSRGLTALYGKADQLNTVGGFVTWRYGTTLAAVLGLWAAMVTSRLLRAEEESGRAELLLSGPRGPRQLLRDQLLAVLGGAGLISLAAVAGGVAGQLPLRTSTFLGLGVLASTGTFGAVAAMVSQVVGTRRRCLGLVGTLLGASYLLRAAGDGTAHEALVWASPLGWTEELSAYAHRPWLALIALLPFITLVTAMTWWLRGRRDAGAGTWVLRRRQPRDRQVRSLGRLEVVLGWGSLLGWSLGMAVTGLLLGFIAADIAKLESSNPSLSKLDNVAGASVASVRGFLGLAFQLVAVVGALYAGSQLIAARREEDGRRLENLLTNGAGRSRWLLTRMCAVLLSAGLMTVSAGGAVWIGVLASGESLSLADAMRGAVNTLPLTALFLGLATVTFGAWPRAVTAVAYGAVGVSYLVLIVAAVSGAPHWVLDLSPLSHLAPVPAVAVNGLASTVLCLVAVALCAAGLVAFNRRDTVSE